MCRAAVLVQLSLPALLLALESTVSGTSWGSESVKTLYAQLRMVTGFSHTHAPGEAAARSPMFGSHVGFAQAV